MDDVTIYLCRHGETPFNAAGRLQGQALDAPGLTDAGRAQAAALATTLAAQSPRPTLVCASDLARAVETAVIVSAALEAPAPTPVPELRERDLGSLLTGVLRSDAKQQHPEAFAALASGAAIPGGGESEAQLRNRVAAGLSTVAAAARAAGATAVVAISHGGAMAAAHAVAAGGRRPRGRVANCGWGIVTVGGDGCVRLVAWGRAGAPDAGEEGGGAEGG